MVHRFRRADLLSLLSFKTAKYVVVRDWRLGILHKVCYILGFLYFIIWRCGYYGAHFSRAPVQTHVPAMIDVDTSDSQYTFEPRPPTCVGNADKSLKTRNPKDYVYELLDAKDMFHRITVGEYFIPTRLEPVVTAHDSMQRTYSEGYSSAVCTAACTWTNLTLNANVSLRQCSSRNTESTCLSSYITESGGRLIRRCVWQSRTSKCSKEPYFVECPPPCGSGCDPCMSFCGRVFAQGCNGGKPDEATCHTRFTYQAGKDEEIGTAMLCHWIKGKCASSLRSRRECPGLGNETARRNYCDSVLMQKKAPGRKNKTLSKDCNIYEFPVQYKPKTIGSFLEDGLGQRLVGAPERLVIEFKHILFVPYGSPSSGNMKGFMKKATRAKSWMDMETESDYTLDNTVCEARVGRTKWITCIGQKCAGESNIRVANWKRDGRAKRCHPYADRTIDFVPLSLLLDLANVTMDCNDPLGRMYASPLEGFTLIVNFQYRNRRAWDWQTSNWFTTMTVEFDSWKGTKRDIQLSSATLEKFHGSDSVFSRGIRILVRTDAEVAAVSREQIALMIPEFFAFLTILESTIVAYFVLHATLTRGFHAGGRFSRLASNWYMRYFYERTPNIAKITNLTKKVAKKEKPIVLNSFGEVGFAGVECDEHAYITKIEADGLTERLVLAWNKEHPIWSIGVGDQILEVNGKTSVHEMDIELNLRQTFIIKVGLHRKYPAVLSDTAMSVIAGSSSHERVFDTTITNTLTPTEIKAQFANFTRMALKELSLRTSTSSSLGSASSRQDSTLHVLNSHGRSIGNMDEMVSGKINSMEAAISELSSQVEDLVQWKAQQQNHLVPVPSSAAPFLTRETSTKNPEAPCCAEKPIAEHTPLIKPSRRSVDDEELRDNGVTVSIDGNGGEATELKERLSRLEQILGHLHEPGEEEHHALKFDVLPKLDRSDCDVAQQSDCAQQFARHLGCDRVDVLETCNKKKTLSLLAIGFVDMEHATQAGETLISDGLEEYQVLGNIENVKMNHRASFWLHFRRYIGRCIRLEVKNIARMTSIDWHTNWTRLEAVEKNHYFSAIPPRLTL